MKNILLLSTITALLVLSACSKKVINNTTKVEEEVFEIVDTIYIEKEEVVEVVKEEVPVEAPKEVLLMSIRRTPCYGKCPVYEANIYQSGRVEYKGQRNVEKQGLFVGQLDKGLVDELRSKALGMDYFSLSEFYPLNKQAIPDLPSCITTLNLDGEEKTIFNLFDAPKELYDLQDFMDSLLKDLELKPAE